MDLSFKKYILDFRFDAGTSRGVLRQKETWFLYLHEKGLTGIGEAGPLKGLSIDDNNLELEKKLRSVVDQVSKTSIAKLKELDLREFFGLEIFPSINFALETALYDLMNGGKRLIFNNDFSRGSQKIPINGLIWMGKSQFMLDQINQKLDEGYNCLKMKIGAIDFETEYQILASIREKFSESQITLRVDANGAFTEEDVFQKLDRLSDFKIHSIEQPVKPGQPELMAELCKNSPVPVALDEELIGVSGIENKRKLLETLKPPFIILKPTLLGGFGASNEWIELAEGQNTGWWITSALESNIGLNAIAQYTAEKNTGSMPQGLGTGQLYKNNIGSPLVISKGELLYDSARSWDL